MNFRYPVFLDLTGKRCVVTGEGFEVAAKVRGLAEASADVLYINPRAVPEIEALATAGTIRWERREFSPDDFEGCFLLITCSSRNAEIFRMAEERNVLCNAVDDPANCRFSYGSVHRSGDLTVGISTNGIAPAIAVRLKQRFQREIGPEFGELLEELRRLRPEITKGIDDFEMRKRLWYEIADSEALTLLKNGNHEGAVQLIRGLIDKALNNTSRS
jgi:precorrin-2 dehydrogenase / sirohydrochlorin ferrochelatase